MTDLKTPIFVELKLIDFKICIKSGYKNFVPGEFKKAQKILGKIELLSVEDKFIIPEARRRQIVAGLHTLRFKISDGRSNLFDCTE